MRNKITIEFDSIDLNSARIFYNIIKEKAKEQINGYIKQLQFQLDCNIPYKIRVSKRAMKCQICYSNELGKVSDIKNSDNRFEMLNDFFLKIQDITYRETKKEFLRNWYKFLRGIK